MTPTFTRSPEEPPFLVTDPPHWAARGLAYFVILLFATALIGSAIVRVPETVVGLFTLVPIRGTDPIRAPRRGQVTGVRVFDGDAVARGQPLFTILSEPVADRAAELAALRVQLRGADEALRNAEGEYAGRRRADEGERSNLRARLASLDRTIRLRRSRYTLAKELADRFRTGFTHGAVSATEYTQPQLEATRLAEELEQDQSERAQTVAAAQKLQHEMVAREAEHRETLRRLAEERARAEIRVSALEQELPRSAGGEMLVTAPCVGSVVRLRVSATAAVVQEGEVLGELACAGERLQADVMVPQAGIARVKPGQRVKLLYDAFPYQRFGVRLGRIRWVSPVGAAGRGDSSAFRALVDIDEAAVRVNGQLRPLLAGMGGRARVVIDRRSLISYAFEPVRQLRESLAEAPER